MPILAEFAAGREQIYLPLVLYRYIHLIAWSHLHLHLTSHTSRCLGSTDITQLYWLVQQTSEKAPLVVACAPGV